MSSAVLARRLLLLGLGSVLAGAALTWKSMQRRSESLAADAAFQPHAASVVNDQQPLPEFTLQSPQGPISRASLLGHWSVVFFGYTQCPDVCPTTLGLMAELYQHLGSAVRPKVIFVSVDPARDTLALLGEFVPAFHKEFVGAHGSDAALAALVRHLGVMYQRQPPSAGGFYTVDHTASMYLIDPQARLKAVFSPPHQIDAVLAEYQRFTR